MLKWKLIPYIYPWRCLSLQFYVYAVWYDLFHYNIMLMYLQMTYIHGDPQSSDPGVTNVYTRSL